MKTNNILRKIGTLTFAIAGFAPMVLTATAQTVSSNSIHLDVRHLSPANAQLVWPNTNGTFVPEVCGRLTVSSAWETIGQWPQLKENEFTLIVPLTNTQQFFRLRQVATIPLPPDPGTVAPPLPVTEPTTVSGATEFLYTGTNAIQTGVASNTIVPGQAGVLRGRVLDQ